MPQVWGKASLNWKEQVLVDLRPAPFDEANIDAARRWPHAQAQRRRRCIQGRVQRPHHEEESFASLRGQVQAPRS